MPPETPLSRAAVVTAAAAVAGAGGLAAVTMRSVASELGVEAMSLYHHVPSKSVLLDELADWVFTQIAPPPPGSDWRPGTLARARAMHDTLSAHPWALTLVESRRAGGAAVLAHHDAVLGHLRAAGFSVALASHTFSAVDAYVYGFVLTEQRLPFDAGESASDFAHELAIPASEFPHLAEMISEVVIGGGYDFADEFEIGLDLLLDGIERRLTRA